MKAIKYLNCQYLKWKKRRKTINPIECGFFFWFWFINIYCVLNPLKTSTFKYLVQKICSMIAILHAKENNEAYLS